MYNKALRYPAAILFDLDGVLIDTEPQYDIFWKKMGEAYVPGIESFEKVIKGTSLPDIIDRYFSHLPKEEQLKVIELSHDFELQMDYGYITGAFDFLQEVRQQEGIRIGLVTSSEDIKLKKVFDVLKLDKYFDTVVSADRITEGKPNPQCYLLAAKDLQVPTDECLVFEDSLQGIAAGNAAGMKVVGVSTTNPEERIREKVWKVIPHFEGVSLDDFAVN